MEFRVLGPVEVIEGDRVLALGGPKPQALLAHLLLGGGRAITRAQLVDELWGEMPPPTARDSLNVHAGVLRRALGPRLRTVSSGYVLEVSPGEIDAVRFEAQVEAARSRRGDLAASASALAAALALWRGPVYGGIPIGPTAAAAAARLDELRLNALEERVEADLALGRHAALLPELTGLLAANPARECLAGQLMLALHRCDRSADALAVYAATCRTLDAHLGVDPGDPLTQLNRAIHRGDPTLAAPGLPQLPSPPSRFIGRQKELARAGELLATARLLTLSGVGGCGKTRLGLELARLAASGHPGGVHLVDLGPLDPGASVGRQVAAVLGVRERRGIPLPAQLVTRLQQRRALLVLDNCERLAQGCAELCSQLLEAAPGLRVLVTSREPLGISGEVVFTVPGMDVPAAGDHSSHDEAADAVRLLVDRASAARPGFTLGPGDAAIAAALCRRLDGLPLAIELAAARLSSLSLLEVATRVAERIDALGGSRSVDARHRTMRACIEWSHEMLDEPEKIALRRISVFAGSFSPGAAEAVVGGWGPLAPGTDVLDVCSRLVDKSMLVAESGRDQTGYRMLEIVRQFSAERLTASGEATVARTCHANWYHDFVPDAQAWAGPDQPLWMDRLRREIDNVHGALAWFLGDGWEAERALEIAGTMWWFWYMAGRVGEGRMWLSRVLAATTSEPRAARALAGRGAAALSRITGEFAEAIGLGEESLQCCRVLGDERGVAAALNNLCITAMMSGDLETARRHGEEGREIIERLGDAQGIATAHNNLGMVARISGDLDHAMEFFSTALVNYRLRGDGRGIAAALSNLAIVRRRRGETDQARGLAVDALRLYTELGFDEGQLDCLEAIAAIAATTGDADQALRLLTVTMRAREELGSPLFAPDELAQVDDALAIARAALEAVDIERITAGARVLALPDAVAAVLAGSPTTSRDAPQPFA
ncbi:MAG: BTAD domain-containing putative transcriptional regulator [Candidatus Dormibacteria bacterium]